MPYFSAYTFTLRRLHEYEADRISARLTGLHHASALVRLVVQERHWRDLWDGIAKLAYEQPRPTVAPYTEAGLRLRESPGTEQTALALKQALAMQTEVDDTHPAFRERLIALGILSAEQSDEQCIEALIALNKPLTETAAGFFLGELHRHLSSALDQMWRETVQAEWEQYYQYVEQGRQRIADLERKAQQTHLCEEELWELAQLKAELQSEEQAIPLLRQLLTQAPAHSGANYLLGQLLLNHGDTEGLDYLNRAMQSNDQTALNALYTAYQFAREHGLDEQAKQYAERAEQYLAELEAAQEERSKVIPRDQFEPHDLTTEQVAGIRSQLAAYAEVRTAYLVRKHVKHMVHQPLYVLEVVPHVAWYGYYSQRRTENLLKRLTTEISFPEDTYVIILIGPNKPFRKVLQRVPNARIFDRAMPQPRERS